MEIKNYNNIVFEDSYILGWIICEKRVLLFLQLLLTKHHPEFEDYNEEAEFGCYKLAIISFNDALCVEGLPSNIVIPEWDSKLNEFKDVTEINEVKLTKEKNVFKTDDYELIIRCGDINTTVLKDSSERAFDKFIKQSNIKGCGTP